MSENDKKEILNKHEASDKELEAVAGGGPKINWPAKCKSSVKDDHLCWTGDACYGLITQYTRDKAQFGCSATVEENSWCKTNDACGAFQIRYAQCTNDFQAPVQETREDEPYFDE